VLVAYQPLGIFNTVVALGIATVKALLIGAVFMELRERNGLMLAFAGAGFFWLAVMLWLAFSDYSTRPNLPPAQTGLGSGLDSHDAIAGQTEHDTTLRRGCRPQCCLAIASAVPE